jgi:ribose 5-phosphate isomerase
VRGGEESPYITDNGNLILNLTVEGGIKDPAAFGDAVKRTIGVVEHGLFVGMTDTCIVAAPDGTRMVGRLSSGGKIPIPPVAGDAKRSASDEVADL